MGTRARRITIEVGGDDVGAGKTLRGTGDDLDKLGTKLRGVGADAKKGFGGVTDEADKLGSKLKAAGARAGDGFASSMGSAGGRAADMLSGGFDIGGIADSLSGMLGSLPGPVGIAAGAAGAAIGGALVIGLEEGMDREMSSDLLSARLGATAEESERLGRIAGDLYAGAYGESIDDVNLALESVLFALGDIGSVTDEELSKAGAMALDFANIWGVDVTEAVGDLGILVSTGLARDWEHAFDLMHVAMGKIDPAFRDDLLPAIEEYSGHVVGLGLTGSEAFALMARSAEDFGSFGIDKSMDALAEFQKRAIDMSTGTVDAFDTIGMDAETMANRILTGGDVARGAFEAIVEGLLGIEDPTARANAAIALFGSPLEDLSVQQIPEFLDNLANLEGGLGDVSGAMAAAGDTANDNLGTRWEELKRGVLDGLVTFIDTKLIPGFQRLGEIFDTHIRPALEPVLPLFEAFFGFFQDHPAILQVIGGLVLLGVILAALTNPAVLAIGLFGGLILAVKFLWGKLQEGWGWVQQNWPLLQAILTNPIGAAVGAISKNWGTIEAGATAVRDWIGARFNEVVSFFGGLGFRIGSAASGMWDGITSSFRTALNRIIGWWNGLSFTLGPLTIGRISVLGREVFGGATIGPYTLRTPNIAMLAEGGIVTRPTLAMIGEGGHDEAVIPLDGRHDMGGDTYYINLTFNVDQVNGVDDLYETVNRGIANGRINDRGRRLST